MADAGIKVEGLAETIAMLQQLPKNVVALGFYKAADAAGLVIQNEVDRRTPVRLGIDNGDLVVEGGDLKSALMRLITLDSNYRGVLVEIGFGKLGYIANWVEYGHRMIGHMPGKKQLYGPKTPGGMVKAYPFMRPAFDAIKEQAVEAFADSLRNTVEQMNIKSAA